MVEGYAEMKNVFKSAPEITFWGGQRFYDRYNIDSEDYFWLNTSGFGVGVYNIHLGPGNLYLAWLGNNNDNLNEATGFNGASGLSTFNNNDTVGNLYKQTFDVRYKDIDVCFGKLSFVLIGNYIKGDTFELTKSDIFGVSRYRRSENPRRSTELAVVRFGNMTSATRACSEFPDYGAMARPISKGISVTR